MSDDIKSLVKNPIVYGMMAFLWVVLGYLHTTAMEQQEDNTAAIVKINIEVAVNKSEIKELRRIADNLKNVPTKLATIEALINRYMDDRK